MKTYLYDTNILLYAIRNDKHWQFIRETLDLDDYKDNVMSVVSWGELYSLALQNRWGTKRFDLIDRLDETFIIANIFEMEIIQRYADIDAYSRGKLEGQPLGTSARTMGKNDLWIAATASILGITLLTTDGDFDHLKSVFLDIEKIVFPSVL
jgi:tRNA(fMet)-specific endonuclease VapC